MRNALRPMQAVNRRAAVQAGVAGLALAGLPVVGVAAQGTPVSAELLQHWAAGWSNLAEPAGDVLPPLGTPPPEPPA